MACVGLGAYICLQCSGWQGVAWEESEEGKMSSSLQEAADAVLEGVVSGSPRVPGVAAIATDRESNWASPEIVESC